MEPSKKNIRQQNGICPANDGENVTVYAKPGNKEPALIVDRETGKVKLVKGLLDPEFINNYVDEQIAKKVSSGTWDVDYDTYNRHQIAEIEVSHNFYSKIGSVVDCFIQFKIGLKSDHNTGAGRFNLPFKIKESGVYDVIISPGLLKDDLEYRSRELAKEGDSILYNIPIKENAKRDDDGILRFSFSIRAFYQAEV